jgi:hypothetical protein
MYYVFDSDDFGASHVISDLCQSHDCRDVLQTLKDINPKFKATLFTIPMEMTLELVNWAEINRDWIELAWHGFSHHSNYECSEMPYEDFFLLYNTQLRLMPALDKVMVRGFKAPGWQISDDIYRWLADHGWWVADQEYNNGRRPKDLPVYLINDKSIHTHTWNCVGNGVYELFDELALKAKEGTDWKFVSEVVQ